MFTTSDGKYDINPATVAFIEKSDHPNLRIVNIVGGARLSVTASDAKLLHGAVDEHLYSLAQKSSVI